jgi:DUF177 domain-containing protein
MVRLMSDEGAKPTRKLDLGRLALDSGQGRRLDLELAPSPIGLGGQTYDSVTPRVPVRLDVSRTTHGWALHLTFSETLEGACVRCLEPASFELEIDTREVDEGDETDEELQSPYVDGLELDLARWAEDAVILAMPQQPLCREDCKGLCAVCGATLNDANPVDHEHGESRDPRWAKLDELKQD